MLLHQFLPPVNPYEEGLLSLAQNSRGMGETSRHWSFFLPGSEVWILADKDGQGIEAVHHLHHE